jgi:hypothetical protein
LSSCLEARATPLKELNVEFNADCIFGLLKLDLHFYEEKITCLYDWCAFHEKDGKYFHNIQFEHPCCSFVRKDYTEEFYLNFINNGTIKGKFFKFLEVKRKVGQGFTI